MSITDKAKEFAIAQHAAQKYGEHPYSYHLAQVSQVLTEFGYAGDESMIAAAWLHDTIEDTDATYEMLVSEFGQETADIVFAVTNEPGENREEYFRKTAPKIASNKKALTVKLADRISNTESNLKINQRIYQKYVKEFPLFKELLYNQDDVDLLPMWNRLIKASTWTFFPAMQSLGIWFPRLEPGNQLIFSTGSSGNTKSAGRAS